MSKTHTTSLILAAVLMLAGCQRPVNTPANGMPDSPKPHDEQSEASLSHNPGPPVVVEWEEKSLDANSAHVIARIDRRIVLTVPVQVEVRLPEGAELDSGLSRFSIPANEEAGISEIPYVIRFPSTPKGDLELVADVQTPAFGVHAKATYRFGRPAPTDLIKKPTGPVRRFGNVELGRAISGDDVPANPRNDVRDPAQTDAP